MAKSTVKITKWSLYALALSAVIAVGFAVYWLTKYSPMFECVNEVQKAALSPKSSYQAIIFSRECGATTGSNTQVSLLPADAELSDDMSGNMIVLGWGNELTDCVPAPSGGPYASAEWITENKVQIMYDRHARSFGNHSGTFKDTDTGVDVVVIPSDVNDVIEVWDRM